MYNGILNVYKEKGFTSHDVVAKLRGILKQKKIGHTGTLDPEAVGVLPVCLGNATKVCDLLTDKDKTYEAILRLGTVTDTQDTSGTVISACAADLSDTGLNRALDEELLKFTGIYSQIPPMYSAIKINGKKLYELAREGKTVERKGREVHIYEITRLDQPVRKDEAAIRVRCSKGTYIRTLCHDIGKNLGCGGCMSALKRTQVGPFTIENALKLSQIEGLAGNGSIDSVIIPVDALFKQWPVLKIPQEQEKYLYNGNPLKVKAGELPEDGQCFRVYDTMGKFTAIYRFDAGTGQFKSEKMFL